MSILTTIADWYTEPFYTASTEWYNARGAVGPVMPPWTIWSSITECRPPLTATFTLVAPSPTATAVTDQSIPTLATASTPEAVPSFASTIATVTSPSAVPSFGIPTSMPSSAQPIPASVKGSPLTSLLLTASSAMNNATASQSSISAPTSSTPVAASLQMSTWDSQAKGIGFVAVVAVFTGLATWGLWTILRRPYATFYSPRSWFLPAA